MNIAPINTSYNNRTNFTAAPKVSGETVKEGVSLFKSAANKYKNLKKAYKAYYDEHIVKPVTEKALSPILNNDKMMGLLDTINEHPKISKNLPLHLSTAGSVVTTYFYANRTKKTLHKDEEQKKRAKTLMLNQWMVTGTSALISYTLNGFLNNAAKNLGYKYREANQGNPNLANRMRGVDVAKQFLIFALTFRYIAPVIVTPIASKVSKLWENRKAEKAGLQNQQSQQQVPSQAKAANMSQSAVVDAFKIKA